MNDEAKLQLAHAINGMLERDLGQDGDYFPAKKVDELIHAIFRGGWLWPEVVHILGNDHTILSIDSKGWVCADSETNWRAKGDFAQLVPTLTLRNEHLMASKVIVTEGGIDMGETAKVLAEASKALADIAKKLGGDHEEV